jgi:O-antigen/teichoic acid export membrane protein
MHDPGRETPVSLRRNAFANISGRAVSAVAWMAVTPYVLARLGVERFAIWSLFFSLSGYVAALDFGMSSAVARFVAVGSARRDRSDILATLRGSLAISTVLGVVWGGACVALRSTFAMSFHVPLLLRPEVENSLGVFGLSMIVMAMAQVFLGALVGFQRLDLSNTAFIVGLAVHLATLSLGIRAHSGLMPTAIAAIAGQLVTLVVGASLVIACIRRLPPANHPALVPWRALARFGLLIQGTNACIVAQMQIGKFLLGLYGSLAAVATFELGFRVANAVWSIPVLVQGAIVPAAARASLNADLDATREVYRWSTRWMFAMAGWVLMGLWLTAPALVAAWLGPNHEDAAAVARVLVVAFSLATSILPGAAVARGAGRPSLETLAFALALLINLAACAVLVASRGAVGAAVALAVSYGGAAIFMGLAMARWMGDKTERGALLAAGLRFALPLVAAVFVGWALHSGPIGSRADGVRALIVEGSTYTALTALLFLVTGDTQAIWWRVRSAIAGRRRGSFA